jgi:hypothetical protein
MSSIIANPFFCMGVVVGLDGAATAQPAVRAAVRRLPPSDPPLVA